MNYRDYIAIMQKEGLRESQLVNVYLDEAKKQQRLLLALKKFQLLNNQWPAILSRRKTEAILQAIETAKHEKALGYRIVEDGEAIAAKYALQKAMERRQERTMYQFSGRGQPP